MTYHSSASSNAEMAVLGAMIICQEALHRGLYLLTKQLFSVPNAIIFGIMETIARRGDEVSQMSVGDELRACKLLDEVGGLDYIAELASYMTTGSNIDDLVKGLMNSSQSNTIWSLCNALRVEANEHPRDFTDEMLDDLAKVILKIRRDSR
jgi:replicative DNA helicase